MLIKITNTSNLVQKNLEKQTKKRKKHRAGYDTKTTEIESEILDTGDRVTGTNFNAKVTKIENKIPGVFNLVSAILLIVCIYVCMHLFVLHVCMDSAMNPFIGNV